MPIGRPGVLIADRWGEVVFSDEAPDVGALPTSQELLDWLTFVRNRCPECEGESR
jgi:hypothetical protein